MGGSEAAFSPGERPNRINVTPLPMRHQNLITTKLQSTNDEFQGSSSSRWSSILSSAVAISSSLPGTEDEISSSVSHLIALTDTVNDAIFDTQIQSEVLSDLAHVALDFFTFLTPEMALLRGAALLGRIFSIYADYIPDHFIRADEAMFQFVMLAVSSFLFAQSTLPLAMAGISSIALAEKGQLSRSAWKNTYALYHLFLPVGISKLQFRCLVATNTIDWVDVDPNKILVDNQGRTEYLYWLYRESTEICLSEDLSVSYIECLKDDKGNKSEFAGLLADMSFLCALEQRKLKHKQGKASAPSSCKCPQVIIKAGPKGARVMRLHKKKLLELMKNDNDLSDSIQTLLTSGMQQMLSVLLSISHVSQVKTISLPEVPSLTSIDANTSVMDGRNNETVFRESSTIDLYL
eukprot:CAMPEP_0196813504 /NCGR_PEP_ID=MMETSP1362-20130617/37191_1 /TAXON_ID=163516 /ORGANISM="Leptocylindrus danicus, Strain CCMP1856" /LENGTH=405 /DNA_ID=CAMNT_0042189777 /DNA_START=341 /DNA_END=1558 /DNA_ORIENTATION=-